MIKKLSLISISLITHIGLFGSSKNEHLYSMLHSPVKRNELESSLRHEGWRGTFTEQAPHTPIRLGNFFLKKAKSRIQFLRNTTNNDIFSADITALKNALPAGQSPDKKSTFKGSPSAVLANALNYSMAVHQLLPEENGDITEIAILMRRKARTNKRYVKGRNLADLFNQIDKSQKEQEENQPQSAASSSSPSSLNQNRAPLAPLNLNLQNLQSASSAQPAQSAANVSAFSAASSSSSSSSNYPANTSAAIASMQPLNTVPPVPAIENQPQHVSMPVAALPQAAPGKLKKQRKHTTRSIAPLTAAKINKEREKKKKELKQASKGTAKLASFQFKTTISV